METVKISYEQARDLLELAVEERGPDFIYVKLDGKWCAYYDHDESPSCIVGWVIDRLGLHDAVRCEDLNETSIESLFLHNLIEVDFRTFVLLTTVQALQDNLVPWGQALKIAQGVAEHINEPVHLDTGAPVPWRYVVEDEESWWWITNAATYDTEPEGYFRLPRTDWRLPLFAEVESTLTSVGIEEITTETGETVTGEVFVEVQ